MTTGDLDLPLLPSAEQIRRREFARIRRGYDPDQVRDYLQKVAEQVETLERELHEGSPRDELADVHVAVSPDARAALAADDSPIDPYERLTRRFAATIEAADHDAEAVIAAAREDAARIVDDARSEADLIRVDAQARAEEARQQGQEALEVARTQADQVMSTLSIRRESLVTQLDDMRTKLLSVAQDLHLTLDDDGVNGAEEATAASPAPAEAGDLVDADDDDLWISRDTIDLPSLAFSELDLDEDDS